VRKRLNLSKMVSNPWVKIHTIGKDILFGLFYRPPYSESYICDHIKHYIDVAMNTRLSILKQSSLIDVSFILVKLGLGDTPGPGFLSTSPDFKINNRIHKKIEE
jgi:hypothetical protein